MDPLFDIVSVVEALGLEQCYADSDDGYLWFKPEGVENPRRHRVAFRLSRGSGKCDRESGILYP